MDYSDHLGGPFGPFGPLESSGPFRPFGPFGPFGPNHGHHPSIHDQSLSCAVIAKYKRCHLLWDLKCKFVIKPVYISNAFAFV